MKPFLFLILFCPYLAFSQALNCNINIDSKNPNVQKKVKLTNLSSKGDYEEVIYNNRYVDRYGTTRVRKYIFGVNYAGSLRNKFKHAVAKINLIETLDSYPSGMTSENRASSGWINQQQIDNKEEIEFGLMLGGSVICKSSPN